MSSSRNHYSSTRKVEILREHLDNRISFGELGCRYDIHPNMIYKSLRISQGWSKEKSAIELAFNILCGVIAQ